MDRKETFSIPIPMKDISTCNLLILICNLDLIRLRTLHLQKSALQKNVSDYPSMKEFTSSFHERSFKKVKMEPNA